MYAVYAGYVYRRLHLSRSHGCEVGADASAARLGPLNQRSCAADSPHTLPSSDPKIESRARGTLEQKLFRRYDPKNMVVE